MEGHFSTSTHKTHPCTSIVVRTLIDVTHPPAKLTLYPWPNQNSNLDPKKA